MREGGGPVSKKTEQFGSDSFRRTSAETTPSSPEEKAIQGIRSAMTFDELRDAVSLLTLDTVSPQGTVYTKEMLLKKVDACAKLAGEGLFGTVEYMLPSVTSALGLREAVKRVTEFAEKLMEPVAPKVEAPRLTPEDETKNKLFRAETFQDVREALSPITELKGSRSAYSKTDLLKKIQEIESLPKNLPDGSIEFILKDTTNALGFRAALLRAYQRARAFDAIERQNAPQEKDPLSFAQEVKMFNRDAILGDKRLAVSERLAVVQTFDDLDRVLEDSGGISGSRYYSPFELKQMVQGVKLAIASRNLKSLPEVINRVTSGQGLREAVQRAARDAIREE